jgi:O-antigen/teichoic acid export membrane protein
VRYAAFFLTAVLLAQLHISQEHIGAYEWMLHLFYTLSFFWLNGFSQAFLIRTGTESKEKVRQLIRFLWGLSILITIMIGVLLWLLGDHASLLLLGVEDIAYWELYLVLILVGLPPLVFEYYLIGRNEHLHLIIWGLLSNGLHVVCTIIPFMLGYGLEGLLYAHIGLNALRLIYMLIYLGIPSFSLRDFDNWRGSLQLSLYTILGGLQIAFDTWLVGFYTKAEEQVAIYRYGAKEFPLIAILIGSIHIGMLSGLAASKDQLEVLKKKVLQAMHWLGPTGVVFLFASPYLYPLVFTDAFKDSAYIFNIYLMIMLSRWILSHTVAMAYNEMKNMNWIAFIELAINVVLSFMWVQDFGLPGIVYASVVAYLFEKIALAVLVYVKHGIRPGQYIPLRAFSFYSTLLIAAFIISSLWLF